MFFCGHELVRVFLGFLGGLGAGIEVPLEGIDLLTQNILEGFALGQLLG